MIECNFRKEVKKGKEKKTICILQGITKSYVVGLSTEQDYLECNGENCIFQKILKKK